MAYYPVTYNHGTICDITYKPRATTVLYFCDEVICIFIIVYIVNFLCYIKNSKNHIYSISEVNSCTYEVIVLTNHLCAHPSFQKPPSKEHEVHCFALNEEQSTPKPHSLVTLEKDSSAQFLQEYGLFKSSTESKQRNIFKLVQFDETNIEDGLEQLNAIINALKSSKNLKNLNTPKEQIQKSVGHEQR